MGSDEPTRQTSERPLAAFDFDGTLTVKDSFMAFLAWRVSRARWLAGLTRLAPATLRYAWNRDRERLKAAAVAEFLTGLPIAELEAEAQAFCDHAWDELMRPDALRTWAAWRDKGARRVIVTASPEPVVAPFARRLGAEDLIGTRLALDAEGRVAGAFDGPNCRAAEKIRRLEERFGPGVKLAAAYGDTSGDAEMLAAAEVKGYRVFTERP